MTLAPSARQSILPDRITNASLASFVRSVPSVDEVGAVERAASLATRSIKRESKAEALRLAVRLMDLTTLEGMDTPGKVVQMSAKAVRPDPTDDSIPSVAAVCVYPAMVPYARQAVEGTSVKVASVATYFPSGQVDIDQKIAEVSAVVAAGADEVDMVIDVGTARAGRFDVVQSDIATVRAAVPSDRVLKVIIESAALTDEQIVGACKAAEAAGADFVKTSTGFHPAGGASVHAVSLMARTVGAPAGGTLGVKASGGIRDLDTALAMIEAGATRLGLSGTEAVLAGFDGRTPEPSASDTY